MTDALSLLGSENGKNQKFGLDKIFYFTNRKQDLLYFLPLSQGQGSSTLNKYPIMAYQKQIFMNVVKILICSE